MFNVAFPDAELVPLVAVAVIPTDVVGAVATDVNNPAALIEPTVAGAVVLHAIVGVAAPGSVTTAAVNCNDAPAVIVAPFGATVTDRIPGGGGGGGSGGCTTVTSSPHATTRAHTRLATEGRWRDKRMGPSTSSQQANEFGMELQEQRRLNHSWW
jgi:hypothetical protein